MTTEVSLLIFLGVPGFCSNMADISAPFELNYAKPIKITETERCQSHKILPGKSTFRSVGLPAVDDSYKCRGLHHEAASAHGLLWHHILGIGLLVELRVLSSCGWWNKKLMAWKILNLRRYNYLPLSSMRASETTVESCNGWVEWEELA